MNPPRLCVCVTSVVREFFELTFNQHKWNRSGINVNSASRKFRSILNFAVQSSLVQFISAFN